jgi:organic hydroperoxide reductase OsmC/OhrA
MGAFMQDFPHCYSAHASAGVDGEVTLTAAGIPALATASPAEFDGPGDRWSPETLLTGAVGDCFILTFRAVARASRLSWTRLECKVTGVLDRVDRTTAFTGFDLWATLCVPMGTNQELAHRLLDKAERACIVANSLKAPVHLHVQIVNSEEYLAESLPASAA